MTNIVPFDITSYILMIFLVVLAILMTRIVFSLTSKRYREKYMPRIKYCLAIGLVLGVILPWNETLGLAVALASVVFFLILTLNSILVITKFRDTPIINQLWIPRDILKRLFAYFSIIVSSIGIMSILLPAILSSIFNYQMNITIMPLAYASISMLTDLFDLTFPEPQHQELQGLLYMYYLKNKNEKRDDFFIEVSQFPDVLENTDFTVYELRETLELLVRGNVAEKEAAIIGRVRFKIFKEGITAIKLEYDRRMLYLNTEKQVVNKLINYFDDETNINDILGNSNMTTEALNALAKCEKMCRECFEKNCYFIEKDWVEHIFKRVNEKKKLFKQNNTGN